MYFDRKSSYAHSKKKAKSEADQERSLISNAAGMTAQRTAPLFHPRTHAITMKGLCPPLWGLTFSGRSFIYKDAAGKQH